MIFGVWHTCRPHKQARILIEAAIAGGQRVRSLPVLYHLPAGQRPATTVAATGASPADPAIADEKRRPEADGRPTGALPVGAPRRRSPGRGGAESRTRWTAVGGNRDTPALRPHPRRNRTCAGTMTVSGGSEPAIVEDAGCPSMVGGSWLVFSGRVIFGDRVARWPC